MKNCKVSINNKIYNSISEAARSIGCFPSVLRNALIRGQNKYKNYRIKVLESKNKSIVKNRKGRDSGCPVKCITTNETFKSIQAVANKLKLNAWTIGLKMEKAGKFIDKDGKEYIRELPIKSRKKNVKYPEQKPFMLRQINEKITRIRSNEPIKSSPIITKIDTKRNAISTLKTISEDLIRNNMYKEASYICEALAQLSK